MPSNPWIGVALVIVGVVSAVAFALFRIPEGGIAFAVVTAGIAIANGRGHETTRRELTDLRASLRPGPDEGEFGPVDVDPRDPFPREAPTGRWPRRPRGGRE